MTNEEIKEYLLSAKDDKYSAFSSALIPGESKLLGVRIPVLRQLAKQIAQGDYRTYLSEASDDTFEEVMLQGLVIGNIKGEVNEVIMYMEQFLPKIHNWSVNDSFCSSLKIVIKNREAFIPFLEKHAKSGEEFEMRVVVIILMDYYLTDKYIDYVLQKLNKLHHEGYYFKMGVSWAIATAYAKYPKETMQLLKDNEIDDFTYNKALRKMVESYRISDTDKEILRAMKRN